MNELATRTQGVHINTVDDVARVAKMMADSGYFKDAREASQAGVKIMAGLGWGIQPFDAMSGVHVIQGKPVIGAGLMAAKVKGSGKYDYRVRQMTPEVCELEFFQGSESIGVSAFTLAEAKAAGTQNLSKFPRNMLFARAISNGVKWFCPDVFSTAVYTPEEFNIEVDADGDIIDVPVSNTPPRKTAALAETPIEATEVATEAGGAWQLTDNQIAALSIAIGEFKFGTTPEGKQQGRNAVAFLAGIDPIESIKDLTREQAAAVLDILGSGENGSYRTDPKKVQTAKDAFLEHLDFQRTASATGEFPDGGDMPDFEPDAKKTRKVKGARITDALDTPPADVEQGQVF